MTDFVLIRHGETEWNRVERFRGLADIPLNDTGLAQARHVAQRLASDQLAAIYSSPLQRTMQTAAPLAESHQLQVEQHPALIDVNFGALEGLTPDEARQAFPEVIEKWLNAPGHCKFPKGESIKSVRSRIEALLDELASKHPDDVVALVSHRVICHTMLCVVLGLSSDALWRIRQDNGCINRFEKRGDAYVLTLMNERGIGD